MLLICHNINCMQWAVAIIWSWLTRIDFWYSTTRIMSRLEFIDICVDFLASICLHHSGLHRFISSDQSTLRPGTAAAAAGMHFRRRVWRHSRASTTTRVPELIDGGLHDSRRPSVVFRPNERPALSSLRHQPIHDEFDFLLCQSINRQAAGFIDHLLHTHRCECSWPTRDVKWIHEEWLSYTVISVTFQQYCYCQVPTQLHRAAACTTKLLVVEVWSHHSAPPSTSLAEGKVCLFVCCLTAYQHYLGH